MSYELPWESSEGRTHLEWLLTKSEAWKITNQINIILEYYSEELPVAKIHDITTHTTVNQLKTELDKYSSILSKELNSVWGSNKKIFENLMTHVAQISQVTIDTKEFLSKLKEEVTV